MNNNLFYPAKNIKKTKQFRNFFEKENDLNLTYSFSRYIIIYEEVRDE